MDEIKKAGQAGDDISGVTEIVVTPEMIEAGRKRLAKYVNYELIDTDFSILVEEVYLDMASANPGTSCIS